MTKNLTPIAATVRKALISNRSGGKMDVRTMEFTEPKTHDNIAEELPFIFDKLYIYMDKNGSVLTGLVDMFVQREGETDQALFHLIDTQMHGIPADFDQTCWVIETDGKSFNAIWTTEELFDAFVAQEIVAKLNKVEVAQ